jgi:hypothetical protein
MFACRRSDAPREQAVALRTACSHIGRAERHPAPTEGDMEKIPLTAKGFAKRDAELR